MVRGLCAGERWIRTFSTAARKPGISEASGRLRASADEVCVTLRWREMDSPPAYRSGISVRQQPRDPFVRAVPMVRIRFPPAASLRTFGPGAAGDRCKVRL